MNMEMKPSAVSGEFGWRVRQYRFENYTYIHLMENDGDSEGDGGRRGQKKNEWTNGHGWTRTGKKDATKRRDTSTFSNPT